MGSGIGNKSNGGTRTREKSEGGQEQGLEARKGLGKGDKGILEIKTVQVTVE